MHGNTKYTEKQAREWHGWYMWDQARTLADTDKQFGLPSGTANRQFTLYRLRGKTKATAMRQDDAYRVDPFGAAAVDIAVACGKALAYDYRMSQGEYEVLQAILKLVR